MALLPGENPRSVEGLRGFGLNVPLSPPLNRLSQKPRLHRKRFIKPGRSSQTVLFDCPLLSRVWFGTIKLNRSNTKKLVLTPSGLLRLRRGMLRRSGGPGRPWNL